jgi:hypothetical protein
LRCCHDVNHDSTNVSNTIKTTVAQKIKRIWVI